MFYSAHYNRIHNPILIYSRNASCALTLISTFLLLSLGRYLCWWTISPQGYHPPSSQCFGTDMIFIRYIYYWNVQFPNNVIINKAKVPLPRAFVTLSRLSREEMGITCKIRSLSNKNVDIKFSVDDAFLE